MYNVRFLDLNKKGRWCAFQNTAVQATVHYLSRNNHKAIVSHFCHSHIINEEHLIMDVDRSSTSDSMAHFYLQSIREDVSELPETFTWRQ